MAFESHRIRYDAQKKISGTKFEANGKNPGSLAVLVGFFVFGLVFFLPLFPPFGLIWCAIVGKALVKELKMQGILKKNVEGKYTIDKAKAKSAGQRSFDEVRTYSSDAAKKYKTRVSESDRMEERQPYQHPHNPVGYSYDACAMERRLEQIKALKEAGILDEKEYQQRKARILAGK